MSIIAAVKKFFDKPTIPPRDVGIVVVTFYYEIRHPHIPGVSYVDESKVFEGQWLDSDGVFGFCLTDATEIAQNFVDGKLPIHTMKNGIIPRDRVHRYVIGDRMEFILMAPNTFLTRHR